MGVIRGLGGSLFVRDAVRLDYCVEASIRSLLPFVEEFSILDCGSTDGTINILKSIAAEDCRVKLYLGGDWDCAPDFRRLAILANHARSMLHTPWHFMIQADEVLHESSEDAIVQAISSSAKMIGVTRYNLFSDTEHMFRMDLPTEDHPCSRWIYRIAPTFIPAIGDAENLDWNLLPVSHEFRDQIVLFHYGFVRNDKSHIVKAKEVQSWFFGPDSSVDPRILAMGDRFEWERICEAEKLTPIPMSHPKAAEFWVNQKRVQHDV